MSGTGDNLNPQRETGEDDTTSRLPGGDPNGESAVPRDRTAHGRVEGRSSPLRGTVEADTAPPRRPQSPKENPRIKGEVSRTILNALTLKGPMNVSQRTQEVERGSVSSVTLRKKVRSLMEEGALERGEGFECRFGVNSADH